VLLLQIPSTFQYTYRNPGTYYAKLNVTDDKGFYSVDYVTIHVKTLSPIVSISASSTTGVAPLTVHFRGSWSDPDGEIRSYYWDFDDGNISYERHPVHIFKREGTYNVKLVVTDDNGDEGTDTMVIVVSSPQYMWIPVAIYMGTSDGTRDTFSIIGSMFKIVYTVNGDPEYGYWGISIKPVDRGNDVFNDWVDFSLGLNDYYGYISRTSYCYEGAGTYYCDISCSDIYDWKVEIYDWR